MKTTPLLAAAAFALGLAAAVPLAIGQNESAASAAMHEAHEKMMQAMQMEMTGDPDHDFAMMMIPHHQGAIDMARVELEYGKDPEMRALAERIIADQEKEIAEMQAWMEKQGHH